MILARLAALIALIAMPLASGAAAPAWRLDPAQSRIVLELQQAGRPLAASFERFTGEIRFAPDDLAGSAVTVTVDLSSFTSGDPSRDAQAKGAPWLDAASHPTATYRTTAFRRKDGDLYEVEAELSLRGVTVPIAHEATVAIDGASARATGVVPLGRDRFGIGTAPDPNGQAVALEVQVAFTLVATTGF